MIKLEYSSNNSGGSFWLSIDDWKVLEDNGWDIDESKMFGEDFYMASKEFDTPKEGIEEFERLTLQDAGATGCTCCGPPHEFSWEDEDGNQSVSGSAVYEVLFGTNLSQRQLLERCKYDQDED